MRPAPAPRHLHPDLDSFDGSWGNAHAPAGNGSRALPPNRLDTTRPWGQLAPSVCCTPPLLALRRQDLSFERELPMMNPCETARTTVFTDAQGKAWESFFLGSGPSARYIFQNQIPNLNSYTRTHPGWVLNDNGYCQWQFLPPPKLRQDGPNAGHNATAQPSPSPQLESVEALNRRESDPTGFAIFLALVAAAVGSYWAWERQHTPKESDYNPHADLDYRLPTLARRSQLHPHPNSAEDILEIDDDAPIPDGYELVDDGLDDAHPKPERSGGAPASSDRPRSLPPALDGGPRPSAESRSLQGGDGSGDPSGDGSRDPLETIQGDSDMAESPESRSLQSGGRSGDASGGADIRDDLELNYRFHHCDEPLIPLIGMTLAQFKELYPDCQGDWEVDDCLASVSEMQAAEARAERFFRKFTPANSLKILVWWVFGLTPKSGPSPYAQKWRHAADICKQFVQNWDAKPF